MTIRDVSELLKENSYQNMTDEEIELLINTKIEMAVQTAIIEYKASEEASRANELKSTFSAALETNNNILTKLIARYNLGGESSE